MVVTDTRSRFDDVFGTARGHYRQDDGPYGPNSEAVELYLQLLRSRGRTSPPRTPSRASVNAVWARIGERADDDPALRTLTNRLKIDAMTAYDGESINGRMAAMNGALAVGLVHHLTREEYTALVAFAECLTDPHPVFALACRRR